MTSVALVAGLGNPGARYDGSPHNVGYVVVDRLHSELVAEPWKAAHRGLVSRAVYRGRELLLLKPQTFMNLSGQSIKGACDAYGVDYARLLVVHDDLDLELGRIKLKQGGGTGGHNGLKSISSECARQDYARLRVGVGPVPAGVSGVDYLLQALEGETAQRLTRAAHDGAKAVELACLQGLPVAMNQVNQKPAETNKVPTDPGAEGSE